MRLTIVGCGYVGMALARQCRLHSPLHELVLTTTRSDRCEQLASHADHVLVCDASQPDALHQVLQGADAAVFCLGPKGDRQVSAAEYRHTFIDSFRCLEQLLPRLPQLQQILYTSSCSVYGDSKGGWVDETTEVQPSDEHGQVLVETESLLETMGAAHSRRVCILRLAALHGPGRTLDQRFRGLAGQTRAGNGQRYTNWVHVEDAAGSLRTAIDQRWSGVVNVVNNEPIQLADLINGALQRQGLAALTWDGEACVGGNDRRISNSRLQGLGYELLHPTISDQSDVLADSQVP